MNPFKLQLKVMAARLTLHVSCSKQVDLVVFQRRQLAQVAGEVARKAVGVDERVGDPQLPGCLGDLLLVRQQRVLPQGVFGRLTVKRRDDPS